MTLDLQSSGNLTHTTGAQGSGEKDGGQGVRATGLPAGGSLPRALSSPAGRNGQQHWEDDLGSLLRVQNGTKLSGRKWP